MKAILLGICLSLAAQGAMANFNNGNNMWEYCQTDRSYVVGYATGAFDAYEGANKLNPNNYTSICAPKAVTAGQLTDVMCDYLRDNPQDRHFTASSLLWWASNSAWPCQ